MRQHTLLLALAAAHVLRSARAAPTAALVFSAGFTDDMVLHMGPARAAVYGFVFPASAGDVSVSVALDDGSGQPVVVPAVVTADGAGSGTSCDASCYAAGYACAVGLTSCCNAPSCPMGCAIAAVVPTLAACVAQCRAADKKCDYTVPNSTLELNLCGDCLPGCGCVDYEAQCEAGCAFARGAPQPPRAWKALLPARGPGGAYTLTATCAGACAGSVLSATLARATFGLVFYASGQSNMALAVQHSFRYHEDVAAVAAGRYANVRFFQYGGMGEQEDASEPAWATTAMTFPGWPWLNLSTAIGRSGYSSFQTFSALAFYFATALTDRLAAGGGAPPPIGIITNAVGGTTIEAWSSREMLAACKNTTTANSAAAPTVLFYGMAAPFVNTTLTGWIWLQGENNCGGDGTPGNSLQGVGYGCSVVELVRAYRALWSAEPGTTPPSAPFGIATLAAGGNEGSAKAMAGIRWSQTGNYGTLPNAAMPNTFLAQAFDLGDPWLVTIDGSDKHHCEKPDPATGSYGPTCATPWSDKSAWDASVAPLFDLVRNDSTPTFLGSIHARIKSPLGARLAAAYWAVAGGGDGALSGPTLAGCTLALGGAQLTLAYNTSILRSERVALSAWHADASGWGTPGGDSSSFMLCVLGAAGGDCRTQASLWSPVPAAVGADGASVVLQLTAAQRAGGTPAAVRYAWPLGDDGSGCCPSVNVTKGLQACTPAGCPLKSSDSLLPGNPVYAEITAAGKCQCTPPQVCDA